MPNRHEETHGNMYNGHLLASETYVGGHVEALEAGVFRSDIATEFKIVPSAVQQVRLVSSLHRLQSLIITPLSSSTNLTQRSNSVSPKNQSVRWMK